MADHKDPPHVSRIQRAVSEFSSQRYGVKGVHIGRVSDLLIDQTDVDLYIQELNHGRAGLPPVDVLEMRLGDPTRYAGLGPYAGFHRHLQRFINFNPASEYAGYLIPGDESLKAKLRAGRMKTPGYIKPPPSPHMEIMITPGVAGALRLVNTALLLPAHDTRPDPAVLGELERRLIDEGLTEDVKGHVLELVRLWKKEVSPDEVVIPKWTYVSHMAEISLAHSEFRMCEVNHEGQVDIKDLSAVIGDKTRAVLFATVGNPLSTAMKPEIFDTILHLVHDKMMEFGHSILVLADTIYEQYRRERAARIDPVQRALKLGLKVPVVEMSSFSKMLAIPGERVGYVRVLWDPDLFPDERHDFMKAMKNVYGPSLDPVACSVQRALGAMYTSIKLKLPVEEDLAPLAAVLTALSELSEGKEMPITFGDTQLLFREKGIREQDILPKKIRPALKELGIEPGYFSCRKVANKTRKIANKVLGKYDADLDSEKVLALGLILEKAEIIDIIQKDEVHFFRLIRKIPKIDRDESGQLKLYKDKRSDGISENAEWRGIAELCNVVTEDVLYQEHKKHMRDNVFQRVLHFANGLDKMRREGVGVYLHPAYYDAEGKVDPGRFNAFYVLWGFEKLKKPDPRGPSQARLLAEKCLELGRPIIATVPGESFLPAELRGEENSYIRAVALLPIDKLDQVLQTIRLVAREMENGPA